MKASEKIQMELMQELVMPIQRIAEYLQNQVESDEELATAIENKESKTLKKCYDYIVNQARSTAAGKTAICVDDSTVFSWAREYYMNEETPKEETPKEETPKEETPKEETPKEETPKADKKKSKKDEKTSSVEITSEEPTDEAKEVSEDEEDWLA